MPRNSRFRTTTGPSTNRPHSDLKKGSKPGSRPFRKNRDEESPSSPDRKRPFDKKKSFGEKNWRDGKPAASGRYGDSPHGGKPGFGRSKFSNDRGDSSRGEKPGFGKSKFSSNRGDSPRGEKTGFGRSKYSSDRRDSPRGEKPGFGRSKFSGDRGDSPRGGRPGFDKSKFSSERGDSARGNKPGFAKSRTSGDREDSPRGGRPNQRPLYKTGFGRPKDSGEQGGYGEKRGGKREFGDDRKKFGGREGGRKEGGFSGGKPFRSKPGDAYRSGERREGKERKSFVESRVDRQRPSGPHRRHEEKSDAQGDGLVRLNKFIANSGVCSRREADDLITMGLITVNGKSVTELGFKVKPTDDVRYEGRRLNAEKMVYILLNKPKGYITTTDDPQERNTVMSLVEGACKERVYPVGRLDRNTSGLLLLTNDGDLTDKLTHPSYNVKKIYKAELDKPLTKADFQKVQAGVRLEEGVAQVDDLAVISEDGKTIGLEIHIGWNRVIRRIFEVLGYEVVKLDRSVYATLDKKDLSRGHWRFLRQDEVIRLKHFQ